MCLHSDPSPKLPRVSAPDSIGWAEVNSNEAEDGDFVDAQAADPTFGLKPEEED